MAKKCEFEGGIRIDFADHILGLWQKIGYTPPSGELNIEEGEDEADQVVDSFTPAKVPIREEEKYAGVTIRQLPRDIDHGEVMEACQPHQQGPHLCRAGVVEL